MLIITISLFAACNIINRETVTPPLATSSWRCDPIPWDPDTDPGLDKNDQALAEQAYLHALDDPGYFINLYFNSNGDLWNSDEVNYLDIYCQYSKLHMTAEEFILAGMDIQSARLARLLYNSGNTDVGNEHLANALAPLAAAVVPLGLGHTGRWESKNPLEKAAMNKLKENPNQYGKYMNVMLSDDRWQAESGWVKMRANINGIEIHYVWNPVTEEYDDFKFK